MRFEGSVWRLPDRTSVFDLLAAEHDGIGVNEEWVECARHLLENVDPTFVDRVRHGDVFVAGERFGIGHAHFYRATVQGCKAAGISAVLAESVNELFQRVAIDQGLMVWAVPGITAFAGQGDRIEVDLATGSARNETAGTTTRFAPVSSIILDILVHGGGLHWAMERAALRTGRGSA
ncbi:hypothetical protein ACWEQP_28290 [Streptomyces sp. NPDC004044]